MKKILITTLVVSLLSPAITNADFTQLDDYKTNSTILLGDSRLDLVKSYLTGDIENEGVSSVLTGVNFVNKIINQFKTLVSADGLNTVQNQINGNLSTTNGGSILSLGSGFQNVQLGIGDVVVTNLPPSDPLPVVPSDGFKINDRKPIFVAHYKDEDDRKGGNIHFKITDDERGENIITEGDSINKESIKDNSYAYFKPTDSLDDGTYYWFIQSNDYLNSKSGEVFGGKFEIKTTTETITLDPFNLSTNSSTIEINGTLSSKDIQIKVESNKGEVFSSVIYNDDGTFTLTVSGLIDGDQIIKISGVDSYGNEVASVSELINLDSTQPTNSSVEIVSETFEESGTKYFNNRLINIKLHSEDAGSGVDKFSFSFNGTDWSIPEEFVGDGSNNMIKENVDTGEGNGIKTINVRFYDNAGNMTRELISDSGVFDDTIYDVVIRTPNRGENFSTGEIKQTLLLQLDSDIGILKMNGTKVDDYEKGKGMYSLVAELAEGTNPFCFQASDFAHNVTNEICQIITYDPSIKSGGGTDKQLNVGEIEIGTLQNNRIGENPELPTIKSTRNSDDTEIGAPGL